MLSVLRRRAAGGDLDERRATFAIKDLEDLTITRYPHTPFASRIWSLRRNLTAYDAAYVALAEDLEAPLVTSDARLEGVPGIRCEVEVVR